MTTKELLTGIAEYVAETMPGCPYVVFAYDKVPSICFAIEGVGSSFSAVIHFVKDSLVTILITVFANGRGHSNSFETNLNKDTEPESCRRSISGQYQWYLQQKAAK